MSEAWTRALRQHMAAAALPSQTALARELGLCRSTVCLWLRPDAGRPSDDNLAQLIALFKLTGPAAARFRALHRARPSLGSSLRRVPRPPRRPPHQSPPQVRNHAGPGKVA